MTSHQIRERELQVLFHIFRTTALAATLRYELELVYFHNSQPQPSTSPIMQDLKIMLCLVTTSTTTSTTSRIRKKPRAVL